MIAARSGELCGNAFALRRAGHLRCVRTTTEERCRPWLYGDKVEHKGEEVGGKIKEGVGRLTDDEELENQGKGDQVKADLKQAADKVKDAVTPD